MAESGTLSDLHDRLDRLWNSYLRFLDAYTTAQKLLQKHMSSGFLSLARANFNARDGVTRYGKDFYHERAVATRRAAISHQTPDQDDKATVEVVQWREPQQSETTDSEFSDDTSAKSSYEEAVPKQQPSPPTTPEPELRDGNSGQTVPNEKKEPGSATDVDGNTTAADSKGTRKIQLSSDPLRWFGILVPRELRLAQGSFASAVDESVAEAVNAAKGMRDVEIELRKLRKEIKKVEKAATVDK
jgi:hypothetical protein